MARNSSGNRGDVRQSALWGSGNRGGELRSNALWGKGGRGVALALVVLALPLAAAAESTPKVEFRPLDAPVIDQALLERAQQNPKARFRVIVQSTEGAKAAESAFKDAEEQDELVLKVDEKRAETAEKAAASARGKTKNDRARLKADAKRWHAAAEEAKGLLDSAKGELNRKFDFIGTVTLDVSGRRLIRLARKGGLTITEDVDVRPLGPAGGPFNSAQLWTHETGVNKLWTEMPGTIRPAIAIVDSGIDKNHPNFSGGSRIIHQQVFTTLLPNSSGDGRGHGTFVAGIAAGSSAGWAGVAPQANLIDLDVMDDTGRGRTSDVIAAAEWIYENRESKNIRVANFSLHSGSVNHFYNDPLNKAVEKLWFAGVVVVAAAGNYGVDGAPSGVRYAPGSDPFVITVGAIDIGGTARVNDDDRAPWSAYGRTPDGFWKPEVCSVGRYMVGPVPLTSTLAAEKADKLRPGGYIELSGTSFSTPVISGMAAHIVARNPTWTPDQVKGALMRRARPVPGAEKNSCGVGQVNAVRSVLDTREAPNPNAGLKRFITTDPATGRPVFNAVSWSDVIRSDVSWDAVSWTDVSWSDVSWDAVSWTDVSWTDMAALDVSWSDVSWEDGAGGDAGDGDGYELTVPEADAAASDPDLLAPGETLPVEVEPLAASLAPGETLPAEAEALAAPLAAATSLLTP